MGLGCGWIGVRGRLTQLHALRVPDLLRELSSRVTGRLVRSVEIVRGAAAKIVRIWVVGSKII